MMIMQVRTRRKRKKKPRLVRGLMRYLVMACILFGTALMYVRQISSVTSMGYEINKLKKQRTLLDQKNGDLQHEMSLLRRPNTIRGLLDKFRLPLTEVDYAQRVDLDKPAPLLLPDKARRNKTRPKAQDQIARK